MALYFPARESGSSVPLGGRTFRVIDFDRRTVLQDHYLMTMVAATGADKVMPMDGEGDLEYAIRLQACIIESGKAPELIAGYILPEGIAETEWTKAGAKETATFIGRLQTEEDRALAHELALEVVLGFFAHALASLNRSQRLLENAGRETSNESLH